MIQTDEPSSVAAGLRRPLSAAIASPGGRNGPVGPGHLTPLEPPATFDPIP